MNEEVNGAGTEGMRGEVDELSENREVATSQRGIVKELQTISTGNSEEGAINVYLKLIRRKLLAQYLASSRYYMVFDAIIVTILTTVARMVQRIPQGPRSPSPWPSG